MMRLCVVLDLDDTLVAEREYAHSGFRAVGAWVQERFGVPDFAIRARNEFETGRRKYIFDVVLHGCGIRPSAQDIAAMVRVYRRHWPNISLLPDARYLLNKFYGTVRFGLITDGPAESQMRKVRALGISSVLNAMVFTGLWGEDFCKPHPRAFQLIESRLARPGWRFVYVADNPAKDFITPLAMNWGTVRVRRPGGVYSLLECAASAAPESEVSDLWQLDSLLRAYARAPRQSERTCLGTHRAIAVSETPAMVAAGSFNVPIRPQTTH